MADYAFKGYDNFVLQEVINDTLITKLDMSRFLTPDYQMEGQDGLTKKIHRYTGSGDAEVLARGAGNSNFIDAEYIEEVYVAQRTQAQAKYYDDDILTDSTLIDTKVKRVADSMVDNITKCAIREWDKTTYQSAMSSYDISDFANAIAVYTNQYESQDGLFFMCDIALIPKLRKLLSDHLDYTEGYIKTGAVFAILGVPVYASKAVPEGIIFLATRDAVHDFTKRGVSVEQDRDIDKKENFIVAAKWDIIALVDETQVIRCGKQNSQATTITTATKATTTIGGAAPTGAKVTAYVNGVKTGSVATASNNAYSVTADANLVAGDKVTVVSDIKGYLKGYASFTVAE